MITFEEFRKLEIRIGQIKTVEPIDASDALPKFTIDIGAETRQIIAGMKLFFPDPSDLVGLKVPVLVNIKPAYFLGHRSEGMIIAADNGKKPIFLVPKEDITVGSIVK